MRPSGTRRRRATAVVVLAVSTVTSLLGFGGTSAADGASALLYDYSFTGDVAAGSVPNLAPTGPATSLTLVGGYSTQSDGVYFTGDTKGHHSIGYGLPASGTQTLNATAAQAVGFGVRFVYTPPATGTCFGDTPNISQIGRFQAKTAQAKLQLSKCADNKTAVVGECRFAGSLTPATVLPVASTLPLVAGASYVMTCTKTPDAAGKATVTISVTAVDPVNGDKTQVNTFSVKALGVMKTAEAISVGNKYPLPAPASNTDQFVGDLNQTVYCVGSTADVASCLTTYLPTS